MEEKLGVIYERPHEYFLLLFFPFFVGIGGFKAGRIFDTLNYRLCCSFDDFLFAELQCLLFKKS